MKNLSKIGLVLLCAVLTVSATGQTNFAIDTKKSTLAWEGKKITGKHNGNVDIKSGTLVIKNNNIAGGNFVIDMNSITCADIENEEYNKKLVGHLKNDDFFATEKYPTASLVLKKIKRYKSEAGKYELTADLTIKGITKSIVFPAKLTKTGNTYKATANITIDRTLWNIQYGSSKFFDALGDKAIKDDINFNVELQTK
ncbi:MAG: YceI family protein [Chitinophagales bacterium]|nr:YceI family protein [Chitinophagales bacterium]